MLDATVLESFGALGFDDRLERIEDGTVDKFGIDLDSDLTDC